MPLLAHQQRLGRRLLSLRQAALAFAESTRKNPHVEHGRLIEDEALRAAALDFTRAFLDSVIQARDDSGGPFRR